MGKDESQADFAVRIEIGRRTYLQQEGELIKNLVRKRLQKI